MTNIQENPGAQRTRRNMMKMGAILVPATLATVHSAAATTTVCGPLGHICITLGRNCFLRGTRIRTSGGERKVEDLAIGDLLPTMFGGLRPVQWIGRYPIKKSDPSKPWVKDALPVRIARSALAPDVPHADLYVTASHSMLIDGVLVPAEALINGTTITRYEAHEYDEMEFFHIKLESHDVVYAEGAPAETLACRGTRGQFRRVSSPIRNASDRGGSVRPACSYWWQRRTEIEIPQRRLALD